MSRHVTKLALTLAAFAAPGLVFASLSTAPETEPGQRQIGSLAWHTDYASAYREAKEQKKMLFIFFRDEKQPRVADSYESKVLASDGLKEHLSACVRVVLPLGARVPVGNAAESGSSNAANPMRLIDHSAFQFQARQQGIAMVDLVDSKKTFYGQVVSAHPFTQGRHYTVGSTRTVLGLPQGTVTQRTMLYVIRMHPERPRSCNGNQRCNNYLLTQAASPSRYMANANQAGHQGWDSRFQQISGALGGRGVSEVAVQGSGRTLVDAAQDCLNLWRSSSSHWSAVSGNSWQYGYDMKRAADGSWYATGLLAYDD